jgi:hypothetical protein
MKNTKLGAILLIGLFAMNSLFSQIIYSETAIRVAESKIEQLGYSENFKINNTPERLSDENGIPLFYLLSLHPKGYMIISADKSLPPVIAYSFENGLGEIHHENVLLNLVEKDLQARKANLNLMNEIVIKYRKELWDNLIAGQAKAINFEQWPPTGTTTTGGWLETNWKQGSPFNQFCPMDPVTNQRSLAGCPSVAIAMLLNYYETLNETELSDAEDDYYHSYSGRNYWVDDDFETIGFLPFPDVNAYFDTIAASWEAGSTLKTQESAALIWACGVTAKQVYTSSISGTFGVNQAFDAFQRFGYEEAELLYPGDDIVLTLAQNMMEARPALLAVIDPGVAGHNLVADGYNTDGFFHLNFGWGGSYNGWYLIPDEIPYNLTEFEGIVANIAYPPVNTSIGKKEENGIDIKVYPNPVEAIFYVEACFIKSSDASLEISDLSGKTIFSKTCGQLSGSDCKFKFSLNVKDDFGNGLSPGIYFLRLEAGEQCITQKLIVK